MALRHGCSPVDLLHISRTPFPRNTSGWLLLNLFPTKTYLNLESTIVQNPTGTINLSPHATPSETSVQPQLQNTFCSILLLYF